MKRKLFIGSSSEGLEIAKKIKSAIEEQCESWIDVNLWNNGDIFILSFGTLESLIKASLQYDYAVFVATNDDIVVSRGNQKPSARDNVIFEAGLFMGALGKDRTFIVTDKAINLPSDFNGTTVCTYSKNDDLVNACDIVIAELNKTRHSYQLRHLPSAALAMGYFDNYIKHFCKTKKASKLKVIIPKKFNSIGGEVLNYKMLHPSREYGRLFVKRSRPIGYKYRDEKNTYWDIPTTLETIRKLVDKILSQREIGKNPECDSWLEKETYNFGNTLEELIKQDRICNSRVTVNFI